MFSGSSASTPRSASEYVAVETELDGFRILRNDRAVADAAMSAVGELAEHSDGYLPGMIRDGVPLAAGQRFQSGIGQVAGRPSGEVLSPPDVCAHLVRHGLISRREIVDGGVEVRELSRRNLSFAVIRSDGRSFVVKQGDPGEQGAGVAHEADVYRLLRNAGLPMPRLVHYDESRTVLVVEFVDGLAMDIYHARRPRIAVTAFAALGRALARLHIRTMPTLPERLPFTVGIAEPAVHLMHDLPPASREIIRAVQRDRRAPVGLAEVQSVWTYSAPLHFDLRWANVLVTPAPGATRLTRVELVDWELAGRGHPLWDVGCLLAQFLSFWLGVRDAPNPGSARGPTTLIAIRRAARTLLAAYLHTYNLNEPRSGETAPSRLATLGRFAATRLLQIADEAAATEVALPRVALLHVQLALNVFDRPYEAMAQLLGLTDEIGAW